MINMPTRMPQASPMAPTSGSTTRPGSTQREAIENPSARVRGGMASDSEARIPGRTMARLAVMRMLAATATGRLGARANTAAKKAANVAVQARNFRILPGSVSTHLVAIRAPMIRPTSCKGSTQAATTPRSTSFRPNSSS